MEEAILTNAVVFSWVGGTVFVAVFVKKGGQSPGPEALAIVY
jgi:hypothetical protein